MYCTIFANTSRHMCLQNAQVHLKYYPYQYDDFSHKTRSKSHQEIYTLSWIGNKINTHNWFLPDYFADKYSWATINYFTSERLIVSTILSPTIIYSWNAAHRNKTQKLFGQSGRFAKKKGKLARVIYGRKLDASKACLDQTLQRSEVKVMTRQFIAGCK